MAVAKTYTNFEIQGEPFKENGRMYVNVVATKGIKKVRWYTDAEYKRMYPDEVKENDIMDFDARAAFGFGDKGYITLYKGKNVEEWAKNDRSNIWYNLSFGYYTPSKLESPKVLNGIEAVQLKWENVMANGNKMRPHDEVRKIVAALLNEESVSDFKGEVGSWVQETVTVSEKKTKESQFGTKHTYTLEDSEGNMYVWETGAKDYSIAQAVSLKMKVKEHKEIDNNKATVVWYCKEC